MGVVDEYIAIHDRVQGVVLIIRFRFGQANASGVSGRYDCCWKGEAGEEP